MTKPIHEGGSLKGGLNRAPAEQVRPADPGPMRPVSAPQHPAYFLMKTQEVFEMLETPDDDPKERGWFRVPSIKIITVESLDHSVHLWWGIDARMRISFNSTEQAREYATALARYINRSTSIR